MIPLTKQVIFRCLTCEDRNKIELSMPNFEPLKTEYESLTEATQHLLETNIFMHEMIAEIKEQ